MGVGLRLDKWDFGLEQWMKLGVLALALMLWRPGGAWGQGRKGHALFVGGGYEADNRLFGPPIYHWAKFLGRMGWSVEVLYGGHERLELPDCPDDVCVGELSGTSMDESLRSLVSRVKKGDHVWIQLDTHGVRDASGRHMIATEPLNRDVNRRHWEQYFRPTTDLNGHLEGIARAISPGKLIFVNNSCFSGACIGPLPQAENLCALAGSAAGIPAAGRSWIDLAGLAANARFEGSFFQPYLNENAVHSPLFHPDALSLANCQARTRLGDILACGYRVQAFRRVHQDAVRGWTRGFGLDVLNVETQGDFVKALKGVAKGRRLRRSIHALKTLEKAGPESVEGATWSERLMNSQKEMMEGIEGDLVFREGVLDAAIVARMWVANIEEEAPDDWEASAVFLERLSPEFRELARRLYAELWKRHAEFQARISAGEPVGFPSRRLALTSEVMAVVFEKSEAGCAAFDLDL